MSISEGLWAKKVGSQIYLKPWNNAYRKGLIHKFSKMARMTTFHPTPRAIRSLYLKIVDTIVIWLRAPNNPKNKYRIDLPSRSIKENKRMWNHYDWSVGGGEEWTNQVQTYRGIDPSEWKDSLVNEMMLKYIKKDSTILEIGPGAGRWTGILRNLAKRLILVDISEKPLSLCRERFRDARNIEYYLLQGKMDLSMTR